MVMSAKERCLFINISNVSLKILNDSDVKKAIKPIIYDSESTSKDIFEYINRLKIKTIVVETSDFKYLPEKVTNDVIDAKLHGVKVIEAHEFYEQLNGRIPLVKLESKKYFIDGVFSIGLTQTDVIIKRFFDLVVSSILLPFAIIIVTFGSLLVFLNSPGNVFFTQERIGRNGKKFKIFKLRTMKHLHDGTFTTTKDDRLLFVGKFLRRTKIDELPQIFNVFCGDMSLIGPRPERPKYVSSAISEYAYFDLRHLVKPGITGWAQVNLPKATPKENLKKLEFDLYYIKNYSFFLDLKIILKTIKVIFTLNSN